MAPTFHALGILALVATTALACIRWREAPYRPRIFRALVAGLMCLLIYLGTPGHLCNRGNPHAQALIGAACVTAPLLFIRRSRLAVGFAGLALAATVGLCIQHLAIVHSSTFTGNPRDLETRRLASLANSAEREILKAKGTDPAPHEAGWIEEKAWIPDSQERCRGSRIEIHSLWHTCFTGIWRREALPVALWYPGGPAAEGARHLEWRDRPLK